jgi:hypothetical protein
VQENAVLDSIARAAVETAQCQAANFAKIGAMARAIARGDVREADRAALAATLRRLAGQCHDEGRDYLKVLQRTSRIRDELSGSALSDDDDGGGQWYLLAVPSVMTH